MSTATPFRQESVGTRLRQQPASAGLVGDVRKSLWAKPLVKPEGPEEVLVADLRAGLTPSDMVERKLLYLSRGSAMTGGAADVRLEAGDAAAVESFYEETYWRLGEALSQPFTHPSRRFGFAPPESASRAADTA
jgi:hypothetical protein